MSVDHDCDFCACTGNDDDACWCGCHFDPDTGERYDARNESGTNHLPAADRAAPTKGEQS